MIVLDTNVVSAAMKRVASRDTAPYEAAGVTVINPWQV